MSINTLCIFGTRPEAIKMAPLIKQLAKNPHFNNKNCVTGQHHEMLDTVLSLFEIKPEFNLQVMTINQTLCELTSKILNGLAELFKSYRPDLIFVHGDTTTTLAASLAAYYHHIDIAHVEAGLRTGNIYSPWPEEINRKLTSSLAKFHFAPTNEAKANLINEAVNKSSIYVTGNTVIDALYDIAARLEAKPKLAVKFKKNFPYIQNNRRLILITGHRRENFGLGFECICKAIIEIAHKFPDTIIIYPVHLNPSVQNTVNQFLANTPNIYLIPPTDYISFVYLMKRSYLILTDSGGIQEEAPALGKPVLVMRNVTERPEALKFGGVKLIGTKVENIVFEISQLMENEFLYQKMSNRVSAYGDGNAAKYITDILSEIYFTSKNKKLNVEKHSSKKSELNTYPSIRQS